MNTIIEKKPYRGWKNNYGVTNGQIEVVITADVGPRIIRAGFCGKMNLLKEFDNQMGKKGEKTWQIRGGHRLWLAPEAKPWTYELDNVPVTVNYVPNGIITTQAPGPLTKVQKMMEITILPDRNEVTVIHMLRNMGRKPVRLAPWSLTVMTTGGMEIIPLPAKVPHTQRLTHNQEWSIWGYTDFADPRWTWGSKYLFLRQDKRRGPTKLGVAHREGWVAYLNKGFLFVKKFSWIDGALFPDGGVNFETFTNEDFLEVETLGPLVDLPAKKTICHHETWHLFKDVPAIKNEKDADKFILPLIQSIE